MPSRAFDERPSPKAPGGPYANSASPDELLSVGGDGILAIQTSRARL